MEGFQKLIPKLSKEIKTGSDTLLLSAAKGGGGGVSAALSATDQPHVLVTRPPPRYFHYASSPFFCFVFVFVFWFFCLVYSLLKCSFLFVYATCFSFIKLRFDN